MIRGIEKTTALYPAVGEMTRCVMHIAEDQGISVGCFHAYRSFEEQAELYRVGRDAQDRIVGPIKTNAGPGRSWHNYGLAPDLVLLTPEGEWTWDYDDPEILAKYETLGRIGKMIGLTWGGDFRAVYSGPDPKKDYPDYPHFQRTFGIRMAQAQTLHKRFGLRGLWDKIKI